MAEQLKNIYFTTSSMNKMADVIHRFYPNFDKKRFIQLVFDDAFKKMELKEKMRHTTKCLYSTLPRDYNQAVEILMKSTPYISGFEAMSLPDYTELYGLDNWDLSFRALEQFTRFSSSEFAIRPFLAKNLKKAMKFMDKCATHEEENVRRFASEGCRPRLPWAMALPELKKDPSLIFPILEKLKNDPSEFVRRSVANNLNDISKDNPNLVLDRCEKWFGDSRETDAIVKHACRSMLKAGNKQALILFGYGDPVNISIERLRVDKTIVMMGDEVFFNFDLVVNEKKRCKVRLEYAVYFMKANGKPSKKVFQISEGDYAPGKKPFTRKHLFKDMTTRKHYVGQHRISVIVNGSEKADTVFELKKD